MILIIQTKMQSRLKKADSLSSLELNFKIGFRCMYSSNLVMSEEIEDEFY